MKLKILKTDRPTPDSVSIHFEKPSDISYHPGQHGIFNFTINGEIVSRTYSFSSSPSQDNHLTITVRKVKNGKASTHLFHNDIANGIDLEQVTGDFYIKPAVESKRHLVMLAGGSGITPIMSMIRETLYVEHQSSISLIYVNKSFDRIIFREELDALASEYRGRFNIYHILTQDTTIPGDYPIFYRERPSKLIFKKLIKNITIENADPAEYFMCGPYSLMEVFADTLQTLNIDDRKVYREHFYIPSETSSAIDVGNLSTKEIIIQNNGEENRVVVEGGKSILEAALSANIRLRHACKAGQCGTCRAYLLSGNVAMIKNAILSDEEIREGQYLLCQSYPLSDDIVIRTFN